MLWCTGALGAAAPLTSDTEALAADHYEGDIFEGITESYEFLTSTL
jgi:hypothetical protein